MDFSSKSTPQRHQPPAWGAGWFGR